MKTSEAKRVEIIIEAPMENRLTEALENTGVTGFTILPVLGGSGRSGRWTREGQISRAGGMVAVIGHGAIKKQTSVGPTRLALFRD